MSASPSDRLAQLAREVTAMMGPISPGRPAFSALSRAATALEDAQAEVRAFESDRAGLIRIGQWGEGDQGRGVYIEAMPAARRHVAE